jgi:hypothetical protein
VRSCSTTPARKATARVQALAEIRQLEVPATKAWGIDSGPDPDEDRGDDGRLFLGLRQTGSKSERNGTMAG